MSPSDPSFALVAITAFLSSAFAASAASPVDVWTSCLDLSKSLTKESPIPFTAGSSQEGISISIDPGTVYQTIIGIGSSLEHATCHNISLLQPDQQATVIADMVDSQHGIGMNLMRICIGTSDFTGDPWYSYDDIEDGKTDPELAQFSIARDRDYVLPILKAALAKNPHLLFFASPWSPPAWMKEHSKGMCGGILKPEWYATYARYLAAFVKAYEAEGIPIYAMTLQNEPGYNTQKYPSCLWRPEAQRDFIRDYAGPIFAKENVAARIWCFDHNFNDLPFPRAVLSDPGAARYVEGTAFHLYEGKPEAMTDLHNEFPDKQIFFSEGSVYGVRGALKIISYFRNWAQSYNAWVSIIDQDGKPNNGPHECSPTMIGIDSRTKTLTYRFDYYMYGQFSRFVQRGAVRIASTEGDRAFNNVAFRNPDGSMVLILANNNPEPRNVNVTIGESHFAHSLGAQSVSTYVWKP